MQEEQPNSSQSGWRVSDWDGKLQVLVVFPLRLPSLSLLLVELVCFADAVGIMLVSNLCVYVDGMDCSHCAQEYTGRVDRMPVNQLFVPSVTKLLEVFNYLAGRTNSKWCVDGGQEWH